MKVAIVFFVPFYKIYRPLPLICKRQIGRTPPWTLPEIEKAAVSYLDENAVELCRSHFSVKQSR